MNDLFKELTDVQRQIDQQNGTQRLEQYVAEQGLRDCQQNADAIIGWLQTNNTTLSPAAADAAIVALRDTLLWGPENPVKVRGRLTDGTTQLPLDGVTDAVLKHSSVAQIKDWQARRRAADGTKYLRTSGSFA